jgi:hypothetical protein
VKQKPVTIHDDAALEAEADAMGAKAIRSKPVEKPERGGSLGNLFLAAWFVLTGISHIADWHRDGRRYDLLLGGGWDNANWRSGAERESAQAGSQRRTAASGRLLSSSLQANEAKKRTFRSQLLFERTFFESARTSRLANADAPSSG